MNEVWDSLRCYWVDEGKLLAGSLPGRSLSISPYSQLQLMRQLGVRKIIDLTHSFETNGSLYLESLEDLNSENKELIGYANISISDMGIPSIDQMREILDQIDETIRYGNAVYVHCFGGLGRTGTVVGCYLVQQGLNPAAALERIPVLRQTAGLYNYPSPEVAEQVEFVHNWARSA